MREILFRGKRIDNGEWIEGYFLILREALCNDYRTYIVHKPNDPFGGVVEKSLVADTAWIEHVYEVDHSTVGEFTGLTDKNGKKVFEGDIYTWRDDYGDYHACVICFGDYFDGYANRYATMARGFYVKPLDGGTFNFAGAGYSEIEISGNIHDNPELLEVEA